MKKHLLLCLFIATAMLSSQAQTAISATGTPPDASAMFDVSATDKGMLIPRVALTSTAASAPITSPLTSLLVYNTAAVSDVTPGYYYWNGTTWTRLLNGTTNLSGAGTTNYLARWTPNGSTLGIGVTYDNGTNVGIGSTAPGWKLDVAGNARIGDNTGQNTLAALAVSAGQGSATTYRDIDLHGNWTANEGHAITASHATGASNIVGQIVFEHNSPGSRIKFGRLYHSGDQTTYPMELVSNGSNAILRMNNDAYDYFGPNSTWGAYLQVGGNGRVTTGASVAATNGNLHLDAANGGFATYINYYSANNTYINGVGANVGIGNTSGSAKLHVSGGGQILGTNGTSSNTRTLTILEDGDAQTNFGSYPGAWTSALQIQSNDPARYVWLSPISTGGNARLVSIGSDFEILPGNTLASTFSSSGDVTTARYHFAQYFNSSDNAIGSGVTSIMAKASDNYFRSANANAVATFLNGTTTGPWIPNNGSGDWQIASSSTGTGYGQGSLELRESNFSGASGTPPHLGMHWGGVVASNISIESSGRISIRDNPGTGYENFIARDLVASRDIYSTNEIYLNNWVRHSDNDGTYWSNNGWHIYPKDAADMRLRTGSGNGGIVGTIGDETPRGYIHWTTSNEIGFLDQTRSWNIRTWAGGQEFYGTTSAGWGGLYANIMYDRDNSGYYVDPTGTSNTQYWTGRAKAGMGNTGKYTTPRWDYTGDANYWTGSMGWGTTDLNDVATWGSGFFDSWSSPGNGPGTTSHYVGLQGFHYTAGANNAYGFQMVSTTNANRFHLRSAWPNWQPWVEMVTSANYSSFGDNLGNHSATTTLNMNNNGVNGYGWLDPYGIGGDSYQGYRGYSIWQESGGWGWPYPDLIIRHHTGVRISAEGSYGGVKILANNGEGQTAHFNNDGLHLNTGWFRPYGNNGIYWESWGKGIHMTDGTWLRAYSSGGYYSDNTVQSRNVNWGDNNMYTHTGYSSGYMEGWSVSDGLRFLPMNYDYGSVGYGYIGQYNRDWYYVYADYHTNTSRRETKKDITPLDAGLYEYVMADIDKIKPTFYRYKGETTDFVEGYETKYKPQLTLGVILDESPDYIQDNAFSGVNIYSAAVLALTGVKYNREKIKEIESKISGLNEEFGNASSGHFIAFDDNFTAQCGNSKPFVTLTPTSTHDGSYYISELSSEGFKVTSNSDLTFSWHAVAPLKKDANPEKNEVTQIPNAILEQLKVSEDKKKLVQNYFDKENKESTKTYEKNMEVWKETMPEIYESAVKENEHSKALYLKYENEKTGSAVIPALVRKNVTGTSTPDKYPAGTFQDPSKSTLNPDFYKTDPLVDPEYIKQEQMKIQQEQIESLKKTEEEKKKLNQTEEKTTPMSEEYYNSLKENLPK